MLLAAALAVVAVGLGLALGLAPVGRARLAGPLRTFALSAALTVVLLHLLPEAFAELGVTALLLFAATCVFPAWARLARGFFGSNHDGDGHSHGGLVAGYVGLLVHHVGDGLGLGAYAALPGGVARHADVMLALAAHTVPLVAVVAFAFQRDGGARKALHAAAGLAGASVLGVVLTGMVPESAVERYSAWVAAFVAGLLVHVVTHDLGRDLPTSHGGRALDALAAIAGVASSLVGGAHATENHAAAFLAVAVGILTALGVPVLVGWVLSTLATAGKKGRFRRALETALGASLGLDALFLALWLGGIVHAVLLLLGGLLFARAVLTLAKKDAELVSVPPPPPSEPWLVRLDDVVSDSVAWIAAAFAFFALLLMSSFPQRALEVLPLPVAMALAVLVALPARVPPVAAVLIAAALERAGLSFAATLVFALLAPAPGAVELTAIARRVGPEAALRAGLSFLVGALALGALVALGESMILPRIASPFPNTDVRLAALVFVMLLLRTAFLRGLRGLLLQVFPSHDTASPSAEGIAGSGR